MCYYISTFLHYTHDSIDSTCDDGHGRAHFHPFLCRDADKETQQKCLNEEVPSWAAEVLAHVSLIISTTPHAYVSLNISSIPHVYVSLIISTTPHVYVSLNIRSSPHV